MPILKQLVLGSSGSKRRSRADLTVEKISAPLADFRHTMHVGHGGDAFGDTSFLNMPHESTNQVQTSSLLPRRFRGSKSSQSKRNSSAMGYMIPADSAITLPYLREDQDVTLSVPQSTSLNLQKMKKKSAVLGEWGLEVEEQRFGNPRELTTFTPPSSRGMKHAESMLSFHVDLGPSMLGDVLGVMDQTQQDLTENQRQGRKVLCPLKSVSNSSSELEGKKQQAAHESGTCSPAYSVNINAEDFLFMDEAEDEIRV